MANSAFRRVTVAFLLDANAQVLVKAAEAKEIVWRNADLIVDDHCLGTGRLMIRPMGIIQVFPERPPMKHYNAFMLMMLDCIRD
jgi:hypothetical protein